MGQYFLAVNLDKLEFLDAAWLGSAEKLRAQAHARFGIPLALMFLLATPERRPRADHVSIDNPDGVRGRWAGDRVAVVGDAAMDEDLPNTPIPASEIYARCREGRDFTDVSRLVAAWFEREFRGRFVGIPGFGRSFLCAGQEVRRRNQGEVETGTVVELTAHKIVIDWPNGRRASDLYKVDFFV
jgi:hypothetical protein